MNGANDAKHKPRNLFQILGPGLITGASDDDPSGIGTYSQAGAQFGFGMLWAVLFTWPLMSAVQEISARIGRTTGRGIAANLRRYYPKWFSYPIVGLLCVANILNIGADIGAMGASLKLLIGGPAAVYDCAFAALCVMVPAMLSYKKYASILRWLTLVLFAYVIAAFLLHVPWSDSLYSTIVPKITFQSSYIALMVGVLGTTISPYLFFWQASEEAEEVQLKKDERALKQHPEEAKHQLRRIRIDTVIGMFYSNAVAWFIMLAAALTLHREGITNIQSAAEAAHALRPLGGEFAFLLFAAGIIGTGLLAVPVLAASAAYAVGEEMKRRVGLEFSPKKAPVFYTVMALATAIGLAINFLHGINPIEALVWCAIINGVLSVPLMFTMMLMVSNPKVVGEITCSKWLLVIGWIATVLMALAVAAMLATA